MPNGATRTTRSAPSRASPAGWVGYLQAVTIAPIEVEGAITYLESAPWLKDNNIDLVNADQTLTPLGLVIAAISLLLFTVVNLMGAKW
ncbi:hypothetical protein CTI14_53645, partial [Methylobacterium radiotolerans]